jgi:pimeloyl-ACP methyl ester carboxylesterase
MQEHDMDSGARTTTNTGGFEERIVATIDGLALYARDYAPLPPETGLPVVCLHGLTRNSRDFEIVAPRIASLGRRVIVPDMRGRGHSANDPDPAHYVPAVYAQDVLTLLDALSVPHAVFVGTSMGGIITMLLAATANQRVAGAALNDIGVKVQMEGLKRIQSYVGRGQPLPDWHAAAEAAKGYNGASFPAHAKDAQFWDAFARRCFREQNGQVVADYDPMIALAFADLETAPPIDLTPLFHNLAAKPTLLLRGAISDLLSADTVQEMRALKPDLETTEVPNIGHAPMLDEPQAWDALLDFLAKAP